MSHQGQPTHPPRPRVPSNPPVPPTVLLRNYASTSSLTSPTPRERNLLNPRPYSYTGNDEYPTEPASNRTRRVSAPSRDPLAPASPAPFPHATVSAAHRRPQPKHLGPRPASASYAPRKPSPLSCPDPPPKPEPPHVPVPIVLPYPAAPIVDSMPDSNTHPSAGPDLKTYENTVPPPPPPATALRPKRRKLEKRRVKEHGLPDAEAKATRHGCGLSFAGLGSLFSKKESCPTPNMLLLKHHYTEQYIPPTFDGFRYQKNPKD
ncbi:hypothetical protein BJ912DRAFT_706205 [Pholiota molesta]|nr:hypothetical protein BJ912DRAFT_706205 [Pholiota molesta]